MSSRKIYLVSPEHLGQNGKLPTQVRMMRKPTLKRIGCKKNTPHNNWLRVRKQFEEVKVLNAALITKIAQFLRKVLTATAASTMQLVPDKIKMTQLVSSSLSDTPEILPTAAVSGEQT
jgi:hypothetical protein